MQERKYEATVISDKTTEVYQFFESTDQGAEEEALRRWGNHYDLNKITSLSVTDRFNEWGEALYE